MDKLLQYKQLAFKIGIPLAILIFIIFILSSGINSKDKKAEIVKNPELSLFKEDELVATSKGKSESYRTRSRSCIKRCTIKS